jgi:hypothetical protein
MPSIHASRINRAFIMFGFGMSDQLFDVRAYRNSRNTDWVVPEGRQEVRSLRSLIGEPVHRSCAFAAEGRRIL